MFSQTNSFAGAGQFVRVMHLRMRSFVPLRLLVPTVIFLALAPGAPLFAQQAAGTNVINNGDFEKFFTRDNLWDGVDGDGYLAGTRKSVPALAETGLHPVAMPLSVKLVDMNGDQLPDIFTADPLGYFRIYFNSGTPTAPKFTTGDIVPLFLWQPQKWRPQYSRTDDRTNLRRVPKLDLTDWTGRGANDLIVGLYGGEVMVIPNSGSAASPLFEQPRNLDSHVISTGSGGRTWGNLFSPVATDWNGDRQIDLILGEGSYSANAVHILTNAGSSSAPKFSDETRSYLAFGFGREHLHPALTDLNGDGNRDLLISDRKGEVSLYLNKAGAWKPGQQLDFASVVSLGGSAAQGSLISLSAGDFNGDGKDDIILGKTNGRVGVSMNTGSPQEPKFGPVSEIKGTDVYKRDLKLPSGWDVNTGDNSGNAWAVVSVVDATTDPNAAPPQGKFALKAFYLKPLNQIVAPGIVEFPPVDQGITEKYHRLTTGDELEYYTSTRTISLVRTLPGLKVGSSYQFSFKYKGAGVREASYLIGYRGYVKLAPDKVTQKAGRGVDVQRFEKFEDKSETGNFSPGPSWSQATKTVSVNFDARELRELGTARDCKIWLTFELSSWDSVLYLDDFQLVEK